MDGLTFKPSFLHQEEEPNVLELNKHVNDIYIDLTNLDDSIIDLSDKYKQLIDSSKLKIADIKQNLILEKERQEDINILCNKYSQFTKVISLTEDLIKENELGYKDSIITAKEDSSDSVSYDINDITGNGYEGNKYVWRNDAFLSDTLDSSLRESINDNNLGTYYEYSRLTIDSKKNLNSDFNEDSIEAYCSIILHSEDMFNEIKISSDRNDIILDSVYTSDTGYNFVLDKKYDIAINDHMEKYNDQSYIYNSGLIAFKPSHYVKLCFKSNGYSDDNIAYISVKTNKTKTVKTAIKTNARRHIIRINDIDCRKSTYSSGYLETKELINEPIQYIALSCNEYNSTDAKYYLIVNGTEYEVVPINCQRNGKKIIRFSEQEKKLENTEYISESIKSVKLKIVIENSDRYKTIYISDVKLLLGGNTNA